MYMYCANNVSEKKGKKTIATYLELYKPNGNSHSYELDQSISVLRVVGWQFSFLFTF